MPKHAFIKHVLGVESDNLGLYGDPSAYYGLIEQQGRLTLHLHLLLTLPESPPPNCQTNCLTCEQCKAIKTWWNKFYYTIANLIFHSHVHTCSTAYHHNGTRDQIREHKGCLDNIWRKCKARSPRTLFPQIEVDPETGALNMRKNEPWLNTFTSALTYVFRCNTDMTSLRSGTAIKAVLLYYKISLMTKMTNVLSAKSEMGLPLICMYLLGHPDHYKLHIF
ncbi:hypothetical protein J132_04487 [Termitomyces sp. J132]|nr:hypothetical protein J132_04487 [Termitomyces sp. J132]